MITQKIFTTAFLAISTSCLLPSALRAAQQGPFLYTIHGEYVTLDKYEDNLISTAPIVVPDTFEGKPVSSIGESAFSRCYYRSTISIPASVTSIGPSAFRNCRFLKSVNIPQGVTVIESLTFADDMQLTGLILPSALKQIKEGAFDGCQKLEKIEIPPSVESIGQSAFALCSALKEIEIPQGIETIEDKAFVDCRSLEKIGIPSSIKFLGNSALAGTAIRRITIPATVKSTGDAVFEGCAHLTRIGLPDGLTNIGSRMFAGCQELKRVVIPPSVTRIGEEAFLGCISLPVTIAIPGKVKEIGDSAFQDCVSIESALFSGKAPVMGKAVFENTSEDFKIFVENPKGYTVPRWHGYKISLPAPEISIHSDKGAILGDNKERIKFNPTVLTQSSPTKNFTIFNLGNLNLKNLSAMIQGGDSSDFSVKVLSKSKLAPGKSAVLEIVFTPQAKGKRNSSLQIISNDGNESPFEIQLSGIGVKLLK